MKNLLLVEDDPEICELVQAYLESEDFSVTTATDGPGAMGRLRGQKFDLALVDLMLPGCSGMAIIREIRRTGTMPIIVVTAKDSDTDKTQALNLGADDYVTKPFSLIELTARIRANIRRATQYSAAEKPESVLHISGLSICLAQHAVQKGALHIELTHTEFEILKLLATHPGQAFSKEQIYRAVWDEPYYGNENALNAHMTRLRNKLKDGDAEEREYIKTLWGIGYKMEDRAW